MQSALKGRLGIGSPASSVDRGRAGWLARAAPSSDEGPVGKRGPTTWAT